MWFFALCKGGISMDVLEERKYLKNVVLKQVDKFIEKTKEEQEFYRSEVENMGIPDLEQKGYFKRCKENVFKCEEKINKLKQFRKNTHFGRMDLDLIEDGNKENITMYLGEKSINDGIINLVYDWRSPVGNLYYMNAQETFKFNDTLYNLNLRRQIEIENAEVINVYNSYVRGRNMNITDDFLLKVLENKKNRNEFSDIIKTIQSNQNNIIRDDLNINSVVQGVAGSGKTVVLLHRLSYLLYNNPNMNREKLLFITPSRIFNSKLSEINRSLSLTTIKMIPMEEYYEEKIKYYIPSIKFNHVIKDNIDDKLLTFIYSDDFPNYLDEMIKSYKSIDINKEVFIKKQLDLQLYNSLDDKTNLEKQLELIKTFKSKSNIKKLMDIIFKDLKNKYKIKNKSWITDKKICKAFAYVIMELYTRYGFIFYSNYNYMFIDEMQDYGNNEFKLIKKLEKQVYLNLYGDCEQAILPFIQKKSVSDLVSLIDSDNTKIYNLNENYRNSKQITNYVNEFLNVKMHSMGINSDEVKIFHSNKEKIFDEIINNYDNNHVIITNDSVLEDRFRENNYEVYSVKMAKGLEFSKVIVIEENFSDTEKYVAFTRTLDKLFIYKTISE
jgi:DNA helicase-2/ATP-dependent DNA helicase PcrA